MLEFIRNRAQTWFAWVIVLLITIPFALWGVNEYFTGGAETGVASVNGQEISKQSFQTAYDSQRQRMQDMLGESFDANAVDAQLKKDVLENLVEQELLVQSATEQGYRISDAQLASYVQSIEPFQKDGKFDKQLYEKELRAQGQNPGYFEAQLRRGLLANQLYIGVAASALVTRQDIDQVLKLRNQQRRLGYFMIPAARFSASVQVGDKEIEEYFRTNIEKYQTPEQVSIQYVQLNAASLLPGITITDQQLRDAYAEQKDTLGGGEERRASHVLISVDKDAPKAELDKAQAKAQDVLDRAKKGESFSELAKKYSDDPGSATLGGDLGYFARGAMVPEFDESVFKLEKGGLSGLVRSEFGFHIIKLEDIKSARIPGFDEVKAKLTAQLKEKEAERLFFEKADKLTTLAYENSQTLEVAAKTLGLSIQESSVFTRSEGSGIASNAKVRTAAFSSQVVKDGFNSDPIQLDEPNNVVVLRVKEHKPAAARPLAEVKEAIKAKLTTLAAQEKAKVLAQQVLSSLKGGAIASELATKQQLVWSEAGFISRNEVKVSPVLVRESFRLPRPVNVASYGIASLASGDVAVLQVSEVKDGDVSQDEERKSVAQMLNDMMGNSEFSELVAEYKKKAKIDIRK